MERFRYLKEVSTLALDREKCTGCGMCIAVCPHQVFVIKDKKAGITDSDGCMECGACALNCPVKAISVESGVGCASGMINEWLDSLRIQRKGGSGCC